MAGSEESYLNIANGLTLEWEGSDAHVMQASQARQVLLLMCFALND